MPVAFIWLFGIWIAASRRFDPAALLIGGLTAAGVALLQARLFPRVNRSLTALVRRPHRTLLFIAVLLWRFIASTLYTSFVILFPYAEGRIVAVPTAVSDPLSRFMLLNAITLTPSTISLLIDDDQLYVHWLRRRGSAWDWRRVKESLERRLNAIFQEGR